MHSVTQSSPGAAVAARLYTQHRSYILAVLGQRCRWLDVGERESVLHDAYVVLLEKQRNGVLDLAAMSAHQIRAYVTQTALHKALDARKRAAWRLSVPIEDENGHDELVSPGVQVEDEVLARAEVERFLEVMSLLPDRRQIVIKLRLLLDRTPTEIQRHLGVTERVYRRELERGIRSIAKALADAA